ncbi:MAG: hypothetical protein ABJH05_13200 [Fulvivirga sp.]
MALDEQHITRAEKYIREEMSAEERTSFEAELSTNDALRVAFDFVKDTEKALEVTEYKRLKSMLKENSKSSGFRFKRWLGIAASVALVATFGYLIFGVDQTTTEDLYNQYYEAYPNIVDPVNRSSDGGNSPFQLYELGNLDEALDYFSVMATSDTTLFYKGQVHMSLGNYEKSVTAFSRLDKSSTFYVSSQWYLALAHLKLGDNKNAERILKPLSEGDSNYADRARKIIESL